MKVFEELQEIQIRNFFQNLQNIDDFVDLLNYVSEIIYPQTKKKRIIVKKAITYFAFKKQRKYTNFTILKRNGKKREISTPVPFLKLIQRCLNKILNLIYSPPSNAYGFILNRNIVQNASQHINRNFVFNIDLENFFGTISFRRVKSVLQLSPFNLSDDLAFLIANLCCNENCLPQGSPTSPILSNIICQRLDRKLTRFAKENHAKYTRYADDLTFSSKRDIFSEEFMIKLTQIIESEKFIINKDKTRLQTYTERQTVTGLIVNEKVNVSQTYIRELRAMLHNWEKLDYQKAEAIFRKHYSKNNNTKIPSFQSFLSGKLLFLGLVRGKKDLIYLKYQRIFDRLASENFTYGITTSQTKSYDAKINYDVRKSCAHNPLRTVDFLQVFTSNREFSLRNLVHEEPNINLEVEMERIKEEYKEDGTLFPQQKFRITISLYLHIKNDLISLYEKTGLDIYKQLQKHPFQNNKDFTDKVLDFKKTYRLGTNRDEETLLSELIKKAFSRISQNGKPITDKFKYYQIIPKNNFNIWASFLTDVERVEQAIWTILNICLKHSNGVGKLKFELQRFQNKLILNIVDVGSICNKNVENLKGGDFETIIQKLWAVCDFNVIANFSNNKTYTIEILPETNKITPLNTKIEGFTYQIIFYTSLPKVLLIDDNKERGHQGEHLYRWTDIEDMATLKQYNVILLHRSFGKSQEIINEANKLNIPIVLFSAGYDTKAVMGDFLSVKADYLYEKLPLFLKEITNNYKVNLEVFIEKNQRLDYNDLYKQRNEILEEAKKVQFPNLNVELSNKIAEFANIEVPRLPPFKTIKQLRTFLDSKL